MDLSSLMQQAREMQEKMNRVQEELASKTVTGSAGGGMVTVQATGKGEIISIAIEDEVVDRAEKELLQDLVSGENFFSQCRTIEIAGCVDKMLAESLANFLEGRFAGFHNFASDDVRVDDRYTQVCEHVGYR